MLRSLWAAASGAAAASKLPASFWPRLASTAAALPDELLPVVAIVGRPNVGKSALFNRLVRGRKALVYDTPDGHVTRDYQEAPAQLGDLRFMAVDTSGLEPFLPSGTIQSRATVLTSKVLRRADVTLLLLDGRAGVLPPDLALAKWLREQGGDSAARVLLAANKCERRKGGEAGVGWALAEAARLGFGEPVALSAETGEGMVDLFQALMPRLDPLLDARTAAVAEVQATEVPDSSKNANGSLDKTTAVKVAIMGLVNVGKSTLTNRLLAEERCLTGPEPGLTRDAITVGIEYAGRQVELVDTAGWVRRARLAAHDDAGGVVAARTLEEGRTVLRFVHVVVLVVDAARALELGEGLTHAEAALAAAAATEGRALVVAANKVDALTPAQAATALEMIENAVERAAPEVRGGAVLPISALTGAGAEGVLPAAVHAADVWNRRVPTSKLNRWLEGVLAKLPPGGGAELKRVKYLSQVKARPPTFVAFVSGTTEFGDTGERFLANMIRENFELAGVPLRITVRHRDRQKGGKKEKLRRK